MNKSKEAKAVFERGFNCAQSILYAHGKNYFKEDSSALKLASSFGAGISYRGELCGAVSGALMIIGLNYGYSDLTMDVSEELVFNISKEFIESFEKQNGSVICNRLLNCDISSYEGLSHARQNGLFKNTCPRLVENSSIMLEAIIKKYSPDHPEKT